MHPKFSSENKNTDERIPEIEFEKIKEKAKKEKKLIYDTSGVFEYAIAPNGQKSNLNEKQWLQVRTKKFKDWFGDWELNPNHASKAIDENGEPLVFYHGSAHDNLKDFDPYARGQDEGLVFFGNEGSVYQGGIKNNLYPCFCNTRRVKVLQTNYEIGASYDLLTKYKKGFDALVLVGIFKGNNNMSAQEFSAFEDSLLNKIVTYLRGLGWKDEEIQHLDDIRFNSKEAENIFQELVDKHGIGALPIQEFAVFNPKNIKSAINNNGKFSSQSTDIYK